MSVQAFRGYWWLPASPEAAAPGQLVVEEDGRCRLELVGSLQVPRSPGSSWSMTDEFPVVLGSARGLEITLIDCFTLSTDRMGHVDASYQDLHVGQALVGAHVDGDERAFEAAIVRIENLSRWLDLEQHLRREGDHEFESVVAERPVERSCTTDDGWTIVARGLPQPFRVNASHSRIEVAGEISGYLVLRPPAPVGAGDFDQIVLELMDLVSLASGEPSGRLSLTLIHRDPSKHRDRDGTLFDVERQVKSYGARTHTATPDTEGPQRWQFLFTCADRPFEKIVPQWLRVRRASSKACSVYFGLRYARPTYTEVRLLLLAITAEVMHQDLFPNETELPLDVFRERRARLLAAADGDEERDWALRKLRNDPTLRERLVSLAGKPDAAARELVVPDVEVWSRRLKDARNSLAHTGHGDSRDIFVLERMTNSLIALVFMEQLGLSPETQQRAAGEILKARDLGVEA